MDLRKKYKQLFEGKARSNDSKLLKEYSFEKDWEDVIDVDEMRGKWEYYVAAKDKSEVQIPVYQGEVGGGFMKDTTVANQEFDEFLIATIDKSQGDYWMFKFDKDSAAALDASDVYGGAKQVEADLEGWSEGELEYMS